MSCTILLGIVLSHTKPWVGDTQGSLPLYHWLIFLILVADEQRPVFSNLLPRSRWWHLIALFPDRIWHPELTKISKLLISPPIISTNRSTLKNKTKSIKIWACVGTWYSRTPCALASLLLSNPPTYHSLHSTLTFPSDLYRARDRHTLLSSRLLSPGDVPGIYPCQLNARRPARLSLRLNLLLADLRDYIPDKLIASHWTVERKTGSTRPPTHLFSFLCTMILWRIDWWRHWLHEGHAGLTEFLLIRLGPQ